MITTIQPLHVGNALRLFFAPPAGASEWKVLRKGTGTFTGHDDPDALLVYQGTEDVIIDSNSVPNEVPQFYCPFFTSDRVTWTPGPVMSGTAVADYEEHTTDVMSHLRERLEVGLKVECDRGNFQTDAGYIEVYTAPPSLEQQLRFPLVTLHLEGEDPEERGIGECISGDTFDSPGFEWNESQGWWARVRVTVVGWSLNSDQRIELRKAIRRLIIGNLDVFDGFGWAEVSLSLQDIDAINGEYPAQLYQAVGTFSCVAPVRVGGPVAAISQVISRSANA